MAEKALLSNLQEDCSSKIRRYASSGFLSVFILSLQNQVRYTFSHYMKETIHVSSRKSVVGGTSVIQSIEW